LTRFLAAAAVSLAIAGLYVWESFRHLGVLNYNGQAPLIAVSAFSLITSAVLLWELSRCPENELGALKGERASLIIGLIFVCVYVPLSIGTTFLDVYRHAAALEAPPEATPNPFELH